MSDPISRDEAVAAVLGTAIEYQLIYGKKELKEGFVRSLIKRLANIPQEEPEWIPVSERSPERLPEAAGLGVLVTAVNGWGQKTVFKAFMGYGDFKWYTSDALIQPDENNVVPEHWKIIAWMPLPEAYEVEE